NAQFRQPFRTRDSLSRRCPGRRRRTHLRRFRRRTSRELSRHRRHVRRNAEGGVGPPPTPHRVAPGPLRRPPPPHPPPGREGVRQSQAGMADSPAAPRHRPPPGRLDGTGDPNFYRKAAARAPDAGIRQLLAGLMHGSVSTLAPVFAAAIATQKPYDAFLVGLAASIGAGISMGFAEALSDDGSLTGRGHPWMRGLICGLMTALGGIGHTLPFLLSNFRVALTAAIAVVLVELAIITWIRQRYMDTPIW